MNLIWYSRITNTCLIVVLVSAVLFDFDRVSEVYQGLMVVVAVLATIVSLTTYFYNQHLLRKTKNN